MQINSINHQANVLNTFIKHSIITCTIAIFATFSVFVKSQPNASEKWVTTYATPVQKNDKFLPPLQLPTLENQTVRNIVRISQGGETFRIRVANTFGDQPLTLSAASVAVALTGSDVQSPVNVTFAGSASIVIPVGSDVYSDTIAIELRNDSDMAINFYFSGATGAPTIESDTYKSTYIAPGNQTMDTALSGISDTFNSGYFIRAIDVIAPKQSINIVAFGDSITDGFGSSNNGNSTYPMLLSKRLHESKKNRGYSVVNAGIGGNRITEQLSIFGAAGLARIDSDVLANSGVTHMVLLEGINDIGLPQLSFLFPDDLITPVTAELLISAYTQVVRKAQANGVNVIIGTILPYKGSIYYTEDGNNIRKAVNQWIRTTDIFDGMVDFDALLRDPNDADQLNAIFHDGDNLHPNDTGYQAMANAFDASMF